MRRRDRERFDELLEDVLESLSPSIHELFEEKPLFIEDRPSDDLMRDIGIDPVHRDEICGLHSGPMGPQRSVDTSGAGDPASEIGVIHLFREGIVNCAGGWEPWREEDDDGESIEGGGEALISEEIRITILHEVGHHFGLDEDDLFDLGYD